MKFDKKPLTAADMVARLIEHGMVIIDEPRAVEVLTEINYYRLSAYWSPFKESDLSMPDGYRYKSGTNFDDIVMFYEFDSDLRNLLSRALEKFEVTIRRHFSASLSLKYGPFPHLEPKYFRNYSEWHQTIGSIRTEYMRSKEPYAEHYRLNYSELGLPPIWAAAELATFGNLSMLVQNLVHKEDRQTIARFFNVDQSVLCNSLHHFTVVRNFTAHHARIWNREFPITLQFPKKFMNDEIKTIQFNKAPSGINRIYNSIRMLDFLLNQIHSSFNLYELFKELLLEYPHIPRSMIGVPAGLNL